MCCELLILQEAAHVTSRLREERILLQVDGPHNNVLKFKSPMVFNKKDADRRVDSFSRYASI